VCSPPSGVGQLVSSLLIFCCSTVAASQRSFCELLTLLDVERSVWSALIFVAVKASFFALVRSSIFFCSAVLRERLDRRSAWFLRRVFLVSLLNLGLQRVARDFITQFLFSSLASNSKLGRRSRHCPLPVRFSGVPWFSSDFSFHLYFLAEHLPLSPRVSLPSSVPVSVVAGLCLHGNLMAYVERDKTLSHAVSLDVFLFKATKG
jgi:hypothetical protein